MRRPADPARGRLPTRGGKRAGRLALIVLLAVASGWGVRPPLPSALPLAPAPGPSAERIPISIRTSWPTLLAAAEAEIPRCTASADACTESDAEGSLLIYSEEDWAPIDRFILGQRLGIKGSIWRSDPIAVSIDGSQFTVSLRLFYRARFGLAGRELASCGYNDAPREATVRLTGEMRFSPDWYVDPTITVDVIPENLCTATMFSFDLSAALAETMREELQVEADDVEERIRQITNVRDRVAPIWAWLSQPVAIGRNLWLELNLAGAAAGLPRITPDKRYLTMPVALKAGPRVVFGPKPMPVHVALPPLATGDISPDFDLKVRGLVTWAQASALLTEVLGGDSFSAGAGGLSRFRVVRAEVSGSGKGVIVALEVRGLLTGTLYLSGTPRFEPRKDGAAGGFLILDDVGYTIETRGLLTSLGVAIFGSRIHDALESAARWDVSPELQAGLAELTKALNRDISPQAKLSGRISSFGPGEVRVGPDGLEAWYQLGGTAEVEVNPF